MRIQNEQRAQKVATPLIYSLIKKPDKKPTDSWSGNVSNTPDPATGLNARWIATFTRVGERKITPMVDFAYEFSLGKGYYDDKIAAGQMTSATGRDKRAIDEYNFWDGLYEYGDNYVKWAISLGNQFGDYAATDGTAVSLTVEATTVCEGTLTLERVI
jgi:hypothetical protein